MNYIKLAEQLSQLPEGVSAENRQLRITAILALAASMAVPMAGTELTAQAQEGYFYDNAEPLRKQLFALNETIPFNVDRAVEVAGKIWRKRYNLAFNPLPGQLLVPLDLVGEFLPEVQDREALKIGAEDIGCALTALREGLAG